MKIIGNLTAENVTEGDLPETRGVITAVHDEPVSGFFRSIKLTGDGIVIAKGNAAVAIPLAELLKLAEAHEELLCPPRLVPEPTTE